MPRQTSTSSPPPQDRPASEKPSARWLPWLTCLVLALITLAAYWSVRHNQFVDFDDPGYLHENPHVRRGFSIAQATWAFGHFYFFNYHPLTLISHMLDVQLFGLHPAGHHFMSVGIHILDAMLLYLLLRSITGSQWRSAFVAGAFALHPTHVESVAWAAERKDVLSTLFWLLTLFAYTAYVRKPGAWRYLLVVAGFALGLLAKPMVVTLPFTLLLLDYWPLKRPVGWKQLLLEKVPLLLISAVACAITVKAQGIALAATVHVSWPMRLAITPLAYCRYIGKLVWPSNLSVLYPMPLFVPVELGLLSALALIVVTVLVVRRRREQPYLPVGWFWYLGTLVPVIGIVQVGAQSMADRYTYVPFIGLFMIIAWGVADLAQKWTGKSPWARRALAGAAIIVLITWAGVTRAQIAYWRDSESLFTHAVQVDPDNPIILSNAGWELAHAGKFEDALAWYRRAYRLGRFPDLASNFALALSAVGNTDEAVRIVSDGLAHFPEDSNLQRSAGAVFQQKGDLELAQMHLAEAVRLNPSNVMARQLLAGVLLKLGWDDRALAEAQRAMEIAPDDPDSLFNLASVYSARGNRPEAAKCYQQFLEIRPNDADAHFHYALTLAGMGQTEASIHELREAVRLNPKHGGAMNNLAWVLSTDPDARLRNGREAVELAERASNLPKSQTPAMLDTLAAAYAESGDFEKAAATATLAAQLAEKADAPQLAASIRQRAAFYRQHQPFRDQPKP